MNRFACHHCGKHLSYRIDQLGKRIKCPKCKGVLQVGMQERPQSTGPGGFTLIAPSERRRLLIASGLIVVAIAMIWYSFS